MVLGAQGADTETNIDPQPIGAARPASPQGGGALKSGLSGMVRRRQQTPSSSRAAAPLDKDAQAEDEALDRGGALARLRITVRIYLLVLLGFLGFSAAIGIHFLGEALGRDATDRLGLLRRFSAETQGLERQLMSMELAARTFVVRQHQEEVEAFAIAREEAQVVLRQIRSLAADADANALSALRKAVTMATDQPDAAPPASAAETAAGSPQPEKTGKPPQPTPAPEANASATRPAASPTGEETLATDSAEASQPEAVAPTIEAYNTAIDHLSARIDALQPPFNEMVAVMSELGLTSKDGLKGELAQAVKEIEDELKQWPGVESLTAKLQEARRYEQSFLLDRDSADIGRHRRATNELDFIVFGHKIFPDDIKAKLSKQITLYQKKLKAYAAALERQDKAFAVFEEALGEAHPLITRLIRHANGGMDEAERALEQVRADTRLLLIGGGAAALLLFILVSLVIAGSIDRPLKLLQETMLRLSRGERRLIIPGLGRKDEIGSMAQAVAVFRSTAEEVERSRAEEERLKRKAARERRRALGEMAERFERQVRRVATSLDEAAERIGRDANRMVDNAHASQEEGEVIADLVTRAAQSVDLIVASTDSLTDSVNTVGDRIRRSSEVVGRSLDEAQATNTRVSALSEAAEKIGEVVQLINDIAEQTNLLALNATIEAARAGEAGKGFAVVASEVKGLANQTAAATEEIGRQIAGIQSEIHGTVEAIARVCEEVSEINVIAEAVAEAVTNQQQATQDITSNVDAVASETKAITRSLSGMTKAMETTGNSASELLQAANDLADDAGKLERELSDFLETVRSDEEQAL